VEGKVALVTGAAGGIGGATVRALVDAGASVFGIDLAGSDHDADLTSGEQAEAAVRACVERFGRLDGVVHCAGASGRRWGDGPVDACTEEGWDRTVEVNLRSAFLVCKHSIPELLRAGGGSIVNVSSIAGLVGGDEDFATHAYAASKAGVIGLSRTIAVYYGPRGIRCNVICPAIIATPMSMRAQSSERIRARLPELHPLTGDFGRPEHVAAAARYLLGDDSAFVTGAVLPVDSGWTAR
jgi:NAD(P)-dependent dehydrogenase (short-subunit alcohol dehydrogenase family)